MSLLRIARLGHPVLREVAADVSVEEIATPAFAQFVDDMIDTMRESDGVGLAAPQVYRPQRLAVIEVKGPNPRYPDMPSVPLQVLINPRLVNHSDEKVIDWEGCLSIPDLRGRVPRWNSVEIDALDRFGKPIRFTAIGFHARVIQHEMDHLDGVVFLDRMGDFKSLSFLAEFQKFVAAPKPG